SSLLRPGHLSCRQKSGQQQQQQQQESQSEQSRTRGQLKPLRLALADWNVFPETTVLAPQQAEELSAQMKLLDDESRLYGKVIFDPLDHHSRAAEEGPVAGRRPNQLAACMFLGNHNRLIDDFLDPLLASPWRTSGCPLQERRPETAGNIRQALHLISPPWDTTCCGAATRLGSTCSAGLTGEFDASQLVVPELQLALSAIQQAAKGITVAEQPSVQELRWALPYRRPAGTIDEDAYAAEDNYARDLEDLDEDKRSLAFKDNADYGRKPELQSGE
uniref:DBR1 domain-containing protein n=1 Tax=Macrostomum lignano TaxID=282301 RepID=A0A1I8FRM4_9PLAT